jgi:hypothetical protein
VKTTTVRPPAAAALAGGAPLPAPLWVAAGPNQPNADLYLATGSLSRMQRRTWAGRISMLAPYEDRLVVSDARGRGEDRVEVPALDRRGDVLPGTLVDDYGQAPHAGPDGRVIYSRIRYGDNGSVLGADVLEYNGTRRRRLARSGSTLVDATFGPRGDVVFSSGRDGVLRYGYGTARERRVDTGLPRIRSVSSNERGDVVALSLDRRRQALVRADGRTMMWNEPGGWQVNDWSGDGKLVLVTRGAPERAEVGVADFGSTRVRVLGSIRKGALIGVTFAR